MSAVRATAAPATEHPELSRRDLESIMRLVYEKSGIALHEGKRALVTARLQKRLRHGGFRTFREYVRYVQADTSGNEVVALLDAIATNHTAFFREPQHFDILRDKVFPAFDGRGADVATLGWCAACSTGEEAYTIAISAYECYGDAAPQHVRLMATDLSTKALAAAKSGIYRAERIAELPRHLVTKYFERGTGAHRGLVQVSALVRRLVYFRRHNLLEPAPTGRFDFIFCRNVMIYFDQATQQHVLDELERHLAPGGYLFTSHSESLSRLRHGLKWVGPAVHRREAAR
jgi:chemotaxis protein methyltransferase CheR